MDAGFVVSTDCAPLIDGGFVTPTDGTGCDFWGALLSNSGLDPAFTGGITGQGISTTPSEFAFVVTNPNSQVAFVTIETRGSAVASASVPAGESSIVRLPWQEICGTGTLVGGYHLTSNVPVSVVQFNPISTSTPLHPDGGPHCLNDSDCNPSFSSQYVCANGSCVADSYTNDASRLLPTHLLGTSYVVASQQDETLSESGTESQLPGLMAVLATEDNTHVTINFAGPTLASGAAGAPCGAAQGSVAAQAAGATATYVLSAGQVLHFWSASTAQKTCVPNGIGGPSNAQACTSGSDLSGSRVTSDLPIAVFGGSDCTFEPVSAYACDHIEEEMLPAAALGETFIGAKSRNYPGATASYPDYWRVNASCDAASCPNGTKVSFAAGANPSGVQFSPNCGSSCACVTTAGTSTCTLSPATPSGANWMQFAAAGSFQATADHPVSLAQYFVSESAAGETNGIASSTAGDPSQVMIPAVEQWGSIYSFPTPTGFPETYVNIAVANQADTTNVIVDGTQVPAAEWVAVPGSNAYVAVHALDSGASLNHTVVGLNGARLGLIVYGYGPYASYAYPGGFDLSEFVTIRN